MKAPNIRPLITGFLLFEMFAASKSQIPNPDSRSPMPEARSATPDSLKGWIPLFDGTSAAAWRSVCGKTFPDTGWVVGDESLTVLAAGSPNLRKGGDIVSRERFSDFDLRFEFKITEGANSGVKYFVQENLSNAPGGAIGMEYQILDDGRNEDVKAGKDGNHSNSSLYDLVPARSGLNKPAGEWNSAGILVHGGHIEHWLNGGKVLEIERGTETFRRLVSESKYRIYPGFGEWKDGHLLLQDHGNEVSFRNIRIRGL